MPNDSIKAYVVRAWARVEKECPKHLPASAHAAGLALHLRDDDDEIRCVDNDDIGKFKPDVHWVRAAMGQLVENCDKLKSARLELEKYKRLLGGA